MKSELPDISGEIIIETRSTPLGQIAKVSLDCGDETYTGKGDSIIDAVRELLRKFGTAMLEQEDAAWKLNVASIADDYHPATDAEAVGALSEMREELERLSNE